MLLLFYYSRESSILHIDGGKKQKKHRSSTLFSRPILQVIECQKWKDLKYHLVHDSHLKEEKNVLDGACLVCSQKCQMKGAWVALTQRQWVKASAFLAQVMISVFWDQAPHQAFC